MADESPLSLDPGPVVDRGDAPDLFVDGYQGVLLSNGAIRLNLYSARMNAETNKNERVIVARLILPVPVFVFFYNAFTHLAQDMHKLGILQVEERHNERP